MEGRRVNDCREAKMPWGALLPGEELMMEAIIHFYTLDLWPRKHKTRSRMSLYFGRCKFWNYTCLKAKRESHLSFYCRLTSIWLKWLHGGLRCKLVTLGSPVQSPRLIDTSGWEHWLSSACLLISPTEVPLSKVQNASHTRAAANWPAESDCDCAGQVWMCVTVGKRDTASKLIKEGGRGGLCIVC